MLSYYRVCVCIYIYIYMCTYIIHRYGSRPAKVLMEPNLHLWKFLNLGDAADVSIPLSPSLSLSEYIYIYIYIY